MEREGRRDIVASLACRVFLDLQVQQVSRELQESLDQADRGGLLDLLGLLEKRDTSDSQDRWDPLELVDLVEKLDQRALQESQDPQDPLVPQELPRLLWMTSLVALRITTTAPLLLLSSVRTKLCLIATPPAQCPWTPALWPP